jgi:hypothetical protein
MGGKRITEGMGFATDGQREFNRGISFHTASVTLCSIATMPVVPTTSLIFAARIRLGSIPR